MTRQIEGRDGDGEGMVKCRNEMKWMGIEGGGAVNGFAISIERGVG